jgi:hypothetical protein
MDDVPIDDGLVARPALVAGVRPGAVPLSFAQFRLWFLDRFGGAGAAYHVPLVWRLSGRVGAEALGQALRDVVVRHESLRTVFPEVGGEPVQRVVDPGDVGELLAVSRVGAGEVAGRVALVTGREFDLAAELPVRAELLISGDGGEAVLVVVSHHIASDGWSEEVLLRDLGTAYAARVAGAAPDWAPLSVQYADYALWQRRLLGDEADRGSLLSRQLGYWKSALAGIPDQLSLPADRPRPAVVSYRGAVAEVLVPAQVHARVLDLARAEGCTVFMVLHAALAVLLAAYGAGDDVPLGTAVAGRVDDALEDQVGFFVNTLVLRTDLSGDPTFREMLGRVRETDLDAFDHQDVPFERVVEAVNPERSMAYHPLFQVFFAVAGGTAELRLPGVSAELLPDVVATAKFDLSADFEERWDNAGGPAGIRAFLEYATDLFDHETITGMGEHLLRLLDLATATPDQPLSRISLLTPEQQHQQLTQWNKH